MTPVRGHRLIGMWRIVNADLWDREYLDMVAHARLRIGDDGSGEIAFGALEASLRLEYGNEVVFFRWHGSDDMTEVSGSGSAELQEDGTLEIDFSSDCGDDANFTAVQEGKGI